MKSNAVLKRLKCLMIDAAVTISFSGKLRILSGSTNLMV
jgi:hypothetical protein